MVNGAQEYLLKLLSSGLIKVNGNLKIVDFSKEAMRMTGYTINEAVNSGCHELFETDHCAKSCPVEKTIEENSPVTNSIIQIKTRSGLKKPFLINTIPATDGAYLLITDLNQVFRLESEFFKGKGRLQAILNSIADGVFTVDSNWKITSFNPSATRITGYQMEDAIGQPCHMIFRSPTCKTGCPLRRTIETGKQVINFEMEIITKEGRTIPISVSTALLIDEEGEVMGGVETFRDLSALRRLSNALKERYSFGNLIGKNPKMQDIYDLIKTVSPTETTVLIQGETGTGKELVARAIHYNSPRKEAPFIKVSCAALPENLLESELFGYKKGAFTGAVKDKPGRFELANGGTIFLDEVGDIPASIQVKLLRVIEEQEFEPLGATKTRKVDVRIISATNKNLVDVVNGGDFREDLYYRLNVVTINLPPLKERDDDIPLLVDHFIAKFNQKVDKEISGVTPAVMDILLDYPWPGNVRQLENAIEHAFVHCQGKTIQIGHLPDEISIDKKTVTPTTSLAELEKDLILETLKRYNWNRNKTAQALGISRITLWRRMKKYNIKKK